MNELNDLQPTKRFSDRVGDYVLYRPSYPSTLIAYLGERVGGWHSAPRVADIGSGTGIFTGLLLNAGAIVDAVEPNKEMRNACEERFATNSRLRSVAGKAEATGLPEHAFTLATFAQAFHWVDPIQTRAECDRILKPGGWVGLIWNDLGKKAGINEEYERIKVEFGGEQYPASLRLTAALDKSIPLFFKNNGYEEKYFSNAQALNEKGLIGRFFSSSYSPKTGDPKREQATLALQDLFARYQQDGVVRLEYKTELFLGH